MASPTPTSCTSWFGAFAGELAVVVEMTNAMRELSGAAPTDDPPEGGQGGPSWLAEGSHTPLDLLQCLWADPARRTATTRRKLRHFACGCARRVWPLLDQTFRDFVAVAERVANARDDEARREAASRAAWDALQRRQFVSSRWDGYACRTAWATLASDPVEAACRACTEAVWAVAWSRRPLPDDDQGATLELLAAAERAAQVEVFQDLFPHFSPAPIGSLHLSAFARAPFAIARAIQDEGCFELMPVLGDALEDAGCDEPTVLAHCRQPGGHARGCWVLDLILSGAAPGAGHQSSP